MDKFAEISRTTGSNKAAKDVLFKTIDPKSSQAGFEAATATLKATAPLNIMAQRSEGTKLPPIGKKGSSKMEKNMSSSGTGAAKFGRNSSAAKSN